MGEANTVDVAASVERFRPALLRLARDLAGQDAEDWFLCHAHTGKEALRLLAWRL